VYKVIEAKMRRMMKNKLTEIPCTEPEPAMPDPQEILKMFQAQTGGSM
jgi:hypothetical protein